MSRRLRSRAGAGVAALILAASTAMAEGDAVELGPELRLSGTIGILTNLTGRVEETERYRASQLADADLESDPSVGFNLELGYRLHPRLAVAAHVEHLPEISLSVEKGGRAGPQSGDRVLTADTWALTADARFYALTDAIQPFLLLGAGWLWTDSVDEPVIPTGTGQNPDLVPVDSGLGSRDGFVARAGGGVDLHLSPAFFLTSQVTYLVPVGPVRDFDYVSVAWGFGYRF